MMQTAQFPYKELCKKIRDVNGNIRFAGIINDNGRLITGAAKDNIQFYVDERDREMLFMEAAMRTRMLLEFDFSLGPMNFSIYYRKNVITMEFPLGNETVYVSAEKDFDLNKIPFEILEILKQVDVQVLESKTHDKSSLLIQS
ncbi:MAG: hypothetical protein OEM28_07415 [Nitrosopumilus sp.]|nr:hypothetical protein [Nitrosopumilus sp.]MDH3488090.1 hypothetical protein [Nitrosopumilus sp.]